MSFKGNWGTMYCYVISIELICYINNYNVKREYIKYIEKERNLSNFRFGIIYIHLSRNWQVINIYLKKEEWE